MRARGGADLAHCSRASLASSLGRSGLTVTSAGRCPPCMWGHAVGAGRTRVSAAQAEWELPRGRMRRRTRAEMRRANTQSTDVSSARCARARHWRTRADAAAPCPRPSIAAPRGSRVDAREGGGDPRRACARAVDHPNHHDGAHRAAERAALTPARASRAITADAHRDCETATPAPAGTHEKANVSGASAILGEWGVVWYESMPHVGTKRNRGFCPAEAELGYPHTS